MELDLGLKEPGGSVGICSNPSLPPTWPCSGAARRCVKQRWFTAIHNPWVMDRTVLFTFSLRQAVAHWLRLEGFVPNDKKEPAMSEPDTRLFVARDRTGIRRR